ncbi:ATP-binding protein [Aphanizomenon flos-aquae NRERC-008]|uniref:ATP-binding protein n=1 Tax=Aphanizomenon flos-aquae FACHB-1249 TaxID=2692889 RepID=A0ABR8IV33_APHFL|nr:MULTISPECIES: ATP-binding protein [Aphanizomenon]MBD2391620.1 ATP-binding protein [Aphanizomenon flos-aquae FACHB-1171]MBD2558069.1 ATP-binding protein [Aphanizomenon flos-aquae FACHB-1290]MBD2632595.1 ATP-binding protein [Aphanizomenon sp. FACHB-1399]MBD2643471.1 ATP-binding protein [Aphanizomenon sp. FACHB-1401]MBD2656279.1 ATP-binding protein [Aphanizomenon flos-aquae FACHB-1265]
METLTVSGTLDSLEAIATYIKTAAESAALDKKATYKLRLAVDEIATNIIIHGYEEAGLQGQLKISATLGESTLTICIEDTGARHDPHDKVTVAAQELNKPLEERQIGGLGVYLAIQGVDQYLYEREGDKNRNIFIVNCK